jgi:hypothetical protein
MLWSVIKYAMYSFKSYSDWITFIPRRVEGRLYIWIAINFNRNESPREKIFIHDFKTRYMMWPRIRYPMYSFQSRSGYVKSTPRRVKARLYIYFTMKFNRNKSPREKIVVIRDFQTRYMLWLGIK